MQSIFLEIRCDLAEADTAIARWHRAIDEDTVLEKVCAHDAIVGTATSPDDGLFSLCGDGVESCGEIVLYGGSEALWVFGMEVSDKKGEEWGGAEDIVFDNWSEWEGRTGMGFEEHGWATIIGALVAELKERGRRIENATTA